MVILSSNPKFASLILGNFSATQYMICKFLATGKVSWGVWKFYIFEDYFAGVGGGREGVKKAIESVWTMLLLTSGIASRLCILKMPAVLQITLLQQVCCRCAFCI